MTSTDIAPTLAAEVNRQLSIKLNVLKRCANDLESYRSECVQQTSKLEQMSAQSDVCQHELALQRNILQETQQMIPSCQQRLVKYREDFCSFLAKHSISEFDATLYGAAQSVLENIAAS